MICTTKAFRAIRRRILSWRSRGGKFLKKAILLEAGAAILFFGALAHHAGLERSGAEALQELKHRGYALSGDPIRVYPAITGGTLTAAHAGGWRPGVISLRETPQGSAGPEVILRHELMHEASFRTCGGKLPLWAEEAVAISFSGELQRESPSFSEPPTEAALASLRRRIKSGANLDPETYRTLSRLVAGNGWPSTPCAVSEAMQKELRLRSGPEDVGFSAILIHLSSGRILETRGDQKAKYPPGSLLKIPYAAALKEAPDEALGEALAKSDTSHLLARRGSLDLDRYRFFLSPVQDAPLGQPVSPEDPALTTGKFWRRFLGERDPEGSFSLEASLPELARVLRASLLYRPEALKGLSRNGFLEGSTLFSQPEGDRRELSRLHALSKTGTVSDERGNPLVGHLMVAWPAEKPVFLAVFRGFGRTGAAALHEAVSLLGQWSARHPAVFATVRVRLMSLTPRESWEIVDECPVFEREKQDGSRLRVSTCGRFRILSTARKSRSERLVSGILACAADGQTVVLETDSETYAEAVLSAEAQDLPREARKALNAVIVWNGTRGGARHPESGSLCDSTHCMVFRGDIAEKGSSQGFTTDPALLALLAELSPKNGHWLSFSKGGDGKWEKRIPVTTLQGIVDEPVILDLRRERTRTGDVMVHLIYPENEEIVSCEVFRNRLKLPSCPDLIRFDAATGAWLFSGIGEGHGEGLSMERARALAESGRSASEILFDAYGEK
ncbi:MAG: hypothetical protein V2B19_14870 [Pseudomonadota bacterium]